MKEKFTFTLILTLILTLVLRLTKGPEPVPKLDENGKPVLDENGKRKSVVVVSFRRRGMMASIDMVAGERVPSR